MNGVMPPLEVTPAQAESVGRLLKIIDRFALRTPAILALESMRPFSFVASQFMHVMSPAVSAFLPKDDWSRIAELLEDRRGLDYLLAALERPDD
ncbi:MAG: hypothetical protein VX589_13665 [Myxococcota bacterium]|nr:hypothetical protein [Myxococcota bacterium]